MIVSGLSSLTVYSFFKVSAKFKVCNGQNCWLGKSFGDHHHHNLLFASKTAVMCTLPIIQLAQLLFFLFCSPFSHFLIPNSYLLAILGVRGERGSEEKMERLGLLVLPPPSSLPCPDPLSPLPCPSILRGFGHETPGSQHTRRGPRPRVLP